MAIHSGLEPVPRYKPTSQLADDITTAPSGPVWMMGEVTLTLILNAEVRDVVP